MIERPANFEQHRSEKLEEARVAIVSYLDTFLVAIYKREVSLALNESRSSVGRLVFNVAFIEGSEFENTPKYVAEYLYDRLHEDLETVLSAYEIDKHGIDEEPPVLIVKKRDTI